MANQIAYGFLAMRDLMDQRVTQVGVGQVDDAINQSVDEHNRQMDALMGLFVHRTTDFKTEYITPQAARLQPLDDSGRARPIRIAGKYSVELPIQEAGLAWGANYRTREKMTVGEANRLTNVLIDADIRWMRDHLMAAFFASALYQLYEEGRGQLNIRGLANGDTTPYLVQIGQEQGMTENHYLSQAAGVADASNPYATIFTELIEHPENGGQVVAMIPTNLKSATEGLTAFRPVQDPNVQPGSGQATLVGDLNANVPGQVIGYVNRVWIVHWPSLPNDYIVAFTTEGDKPLALREEPMSSLQGFKKVAERTDHPFYESQYLRIAGFAGWNRVGALVYRCNNAAYAVPVGFETPMG